jgi:hypothetical protein
VRIVQVRYGFGWETVVTVMHEFFRLTNFEAICLEEMGVKV